MNTRYFWFQGRREGVELDALAAETPTARDLAEAVRVIGETVMIQSGGPTVANRHADGYGWRRLTAARVDDRLNYEQSTWGVDPAERPIAEWRWLRAQPGESLHVYFVRNARAINRNGPTGSRLLGPAYQPGGRAIQYTEVS